MKSEKEIISKYEELASRKRVVVDQRTSQERESFYLRIQDINAKMSTIDWILEDGVDDI